MTGFGLDNGNTGCRSSAEFSHVDQVALCQIVDGDQVFGFLYGRIDGKLSLTSFSLDRLILIR